MPNPDTLHAADLSELKGFDAVIDVRSPAEFAEDHLPGAINLPVLSNEERAVVGTIYVQDSAFRARKIGAALVARNVAHHLQTALADMPSTFKPLIYCWRGGQRSNAMATILAQIGWRTLVLGGGYRTYRRAVQQRLYDAPLGLDLILLDGDTGTGKTDVLRSLSRLGVQTIDLEALAEHRGSLFGGRPGHPQPSQKMFESRLLSALRDLDPRQPVIVEAESHKIGDRMLPPVLWHAMAEAPRIVLRTARSQRATYLARTYADIAADLPSLKALIARLPVHISKASIEHLGALADAGDLTGLADALMELHYDPAYARSNRKDQRRVIGTVDVGRLDHAGIEAAASAVADLVETGGAGPMAGGQGLEP